MTGFAFLKQSWSRLIVLATCLTLSATNSGTWGQDSANNVPPAVSGEPNSAEQPNIPVPPISDKHPLYLPLVEAYKAREALKNINDYEADFIKREHIGRKLLTTTMKLKLREKPFSVYLRFVEPNGGREVIYVEGKNKDKQNKSNLVVHEPGLGAVLGTMNLLPTSPTAMADNKYPVTKIGLKTMIDTVIDQWERQGKLESGITAQKYPNAQLDTKEQCVAYESTCAKPTQEFPYYITRLWIDKKTGLAIRVEQLGMPQNGSKNPPVIEEYTYGALKLNVPLADLDFDTRNKNYKFQ